MKVTVRTSIIKIWLFQLCIFWTHPSFATRLCLTVECHRLISPNAQGRFIRLLCSRSRTYIVVFKVKVIVTVQNFNLLFSWCSTDMGLNPRLGVAKDLFPRGNFQWRLKNAKHCQPYHCLDRQNYCATHTNRNGYKLVSAVMVTLIDVFSWFSVIFDTVTLILDRVPPSTPPPPPTPFY